MKCPHCTNGRVVLFTSISDCEFCGGRGEDDPLREHMDEVLATFILNVKLEGFRVLSPSATPKVGFASEKVPLPAEPDRGDWEYARSCLCQALSRNLKSVWATCGGAVAFGPLDIDHPRIEKDGIVLTFWLEDGFWHAGFTC